MEGSFQSVLTEELSIWIYDHGNSPANSPVSFDTLIGKLAMPIPAFTIIEWVASVPRGIVWPNVTHVVNEPSKSGFKHPKERHGTEW